MNKIPHIAHVNRLKKLERQSMSAYRSIIAAIKTDIKKALRKEKLMKSDGWSGEIPRINIDLTRVIAPMLDRHLSALRWLMFGVYAGTEATEAAKKLGWDKLFTPGLIPVAYTDSLDTQALHFSHMTGADAPRLPDEFVAMSIDEMVNRTKVFLDQTIEGLKAHIIGAVQNEIDRQNYKNLNAGHKAAVNDEDIEDSVDKLSAGSLDKEINYASKKFQKNWEIASQASIAKASGVGAHQSMVEFFGQDDENIRVVNVMIEDERLCTFCRNISKTVDGKWKYYKLKSLEPSGYNFSRKKADWKVSVAPQHHRCFSSDMDVLTNKGWTPWPDVDGSEQFLSVNLETGGAEWVKAKKLIKQHYQGPMELRSSKIANFMTTPGHDHVIKFRINKGRPEQREWHLAPGETLPGYDYSFLATIPNWQGKNVDTITVAGQKFEKMAFVRFMAAFLSEGSISRPPHHKKWQVKISQVKYHEEFLGFVQGIFDKVWDGKESVYAPVYNDEFAEYLRSFGKSWEKFIPNEIKELDKEALLEFLRVYNLGDGSLTKLKKLKGQKKESIARTFYTSSPKMVSDLSELLLKTGKRPSFHFEKAKVCHHRNGDYLTKHPCWRITEGRSSAYSASNMDVQQVGYDDFVYDVELERNHTLIVRRNGRVVVSGNCRCQTVYVPRGFEVDDRGIIVPIK